MVGSTIEIKNALEVIAKRIEVLEETSNYIENSEYKKLRQEQDALYLLLKRAKGGIDI